MYNGFTKDILWMNTKVCSIANCVKVCTNCEPTHKCALSGNSVTFVRFTSQMFHSADKASAPLCGEKQSF